MTPGYRVMTVDDFYDICEELLLLSGPQVEFDYEFAGGLLTSCYRHPELPQFCDGTECGTRILYLEFSTALPPGPA